MTENKITAASVPTLVSELDRVTDLLSKYQHCWGENPSNRMYSWIDTFDSIYILRREAYTAWMDSHGWIREGGGGHRTAYDFLC